MTKETIEQVLKFRDERNWKQFHNPKDLAISISLEAAELLEVFQWSAEDVWCEEKKDKIREELADVLNYCILMADICGLNMDEIFPDWNSYFPMLCKSEYLSYEMMWKYPGIQEEFEKCAREHLNNQEIRLKLYQPGLSEREFSERLEEVIFPVYQSAKSMGFSNWRLKV